MTSSIGRYPVPGTATAMHEAAIRRTSPIAGIQCRKLTSPCIVPRPRPSPFACKPLIHPTPGSRYPETFEEEQLAGAAGPDARPGAPSQELTGTSGRQEVHHEVQVTRRA